MPDLEPVYAKLPIALQHAVCSVAGWRVEHSRFGGQFPRLLAEAESRGFISEDEAQAFRDQRLRNFVQHCFQNVPFHRRRFEEAGVAPGDIKGLEDMARLPVLTKSQVKERSMELELSRVPGHRRRAVHTSGTTGGGLRFSSSLEAIQEQWAVWWRYRHWHGIQRGTWCGHFAGRMVVSPPQRKPPFWRINRPGKQIVFSGYHMSPERLPSYVEELRRRQPPWLHGYPSLLALLAGHVLQAQSDLGYEIRWISTGAENLLPHQMELISRAFGVRPVQHYGMAEAVANISECDHGRLHIDEDFAAVELIQRELGGHSIVGTNFTNPLTPFLRYEVEDIVALEPDSSCTCGRPGRVVERIDGRLEDYVMLKDGTRIGRMDHVFKNMVNVREAQIHQKQPGEMTIRVVRMAGYTQADEEAVLRETRKRVGDGAEVKLEYADRLERSAIGKLRFVVSEVPTPLLRADRESSSGRL
jgi:phenylacetate-coenzyme A ligase PaaK-like adenylate-forming protein